MRLSSLAPAEPVVLAAARLAAARSRMVPGRRPSSASAALLAAGLVAVAASSQPLGAVPLTAPSPMAPDGAVATADLAALIPGVDPRVYLRARKPLPSAARDLAALPASVSLRILGDAARGDGPEPFLAPRSAYPASLPQDDVESLRVLEVRALVTGALAAVVAHARAARAPLDLTVFRPHLASADPHVRAAAARNLGHSSDDVVGVLAAVAATDGDPAVRAAACVGLGHQHRAAALAALEPLALDGADPTRQAAAIRAIAAVGSAWYWQARGQPGEGTLLRARGLAAVAKLMGAPHGPAVDKAIREASDRLR